MTARRDVAGEPERFSTLGGCIVPRTADGPDVMAEEQGTPSAARTAVCALAAGTVDDGFATLDRLGIDRASFPASGVHAEKRVNCSNIREVALTEAVLRRAVHRPAVVHGSEPGKVRLAPFAGLRASGALVTTGASDAAAGQVEAVWAASPGPFLLARPS